MPYIKQEKRWKLDGIVDCIACDFLTSGELNYFITRILLATKPKHYDDFNCLLGVLEAVKQEFYRRVVAPYEDKKREENGDVYL